MVRRISLIITILIIANCAYAQRGVVVDNADRNPISAASVFDKSGAIIGMTTMQGALPAISSTDYPIIIRCLGYEPAEISEATDTIGLIATAYDLPELTYNSDDRDIVRLVCYVREYMSAVSATDTVIAYSDNMVDYMIPLRKLKKNKVSNAPRVLAKRNYARYANNKGLDSVAVNVDDEMLSWISFMRIDTGMVAEPLSLRDKTGGMDSIGGKHGLKAIYRKNQITFTKSVDGLADHKEHKMSPMFFKLLGFTIDFTEMTFVNTFNRNNTGKYRPTDLNCISLSIKALARGKIWKKAFDTKSPIEMHTYYEVYPVEKEFLTLEEAKELSENRPKKVQITAPEYAAPLNAATLELIRRGKESSNKK